MIIKFSNGRSYEYITAVSIEKDHYKGETRASVEVHLPLAQTSYDEINGIVNDAGIIRSFTLVGEAKVNEDGTLGEAPEKLYEGYIFGDRIVTENGILKFKKFKAATAEIERDEAVKAIDELLIAMEV